MKMLPLSAWLVFAGVLLPVARADQIDDLISRLRAGAGPLEPAAQNQIVQAALSKTSSAQSKALADAYISQIKASIVDEENHGGWPCRSWLVVQATPRRIVTASLKGRFERTPDAITAYAMICPAIYANDDLLVNKALEYLKRFDPFLYEHAQAKMATFWLPFIRDIQRKQTPSTKGAKVEKDDPTSVLPR